MEARIQKLLDAFDHMRDTIDADATFGEPVVVNDRTVVPVTELAYRFEVDAGLGSGVREGTVGEAGDGPGGGGAIITRPLAVIEMTPEGARVKPIVDEQRVFWGISLLAGWIAFWVATAVARILGQRD
jgi:uncharacterized spore protein YtfJ